MSTPEAELLRLLTAVAVRAMRDFEHPTQDGRLRGSTYEALRDAVEEARRAGVGEAPPQITLGAAR